MSKDEQKTFTREERSKFFRQAEQEYFDKTYGETPPLDKSFMETEKGKDKSSRRKRYSLIAVAAVVMICIASIAQPLIGNNEAYGDKGILHRIYDSIMGIDTDVQDGNNQERERRVEINDLENIDEAKDLCEKLYVPQYVPEGFELESLVVEKTKAGVDADYIFKNGEKELNIGMSFMESDSATYGSNNQGELIRLKDRIIVPDRRKAVVEMYTEEGIMMISGDTTRDEMVKLARGLMKA